MEELKDLQPTENLIDPEVEKYVYTEMAKIDGAHKLFRALMNRDMKFYFISPKEQQELAKGAYFRMEYLAKKIKAHSLDKDK